MRPAMTPQHMPPAGCDPDAIKLFVGNIPKSYTESQLLPLFATVGRVVEIVIVRDRITHQSKGIAFVWYETRAMAQDAIQRLHKQHVLPDAMGKQKQAMVVREAKQPTADVANMTSGDRLAMYWQEWQPQTCDQELPLYNAAGYPQINLSSLDGNAMGRVMMAPPNVPPNIPRPHDGMGMKSHEVMLMASQAAGQNLVMPQAQAPRPIPFLQEGGQEAPEQDMSWDEMTRNILLASQSNFLSSTSPGLEKGSRQLSSRDSMDRGSGLSGHSLCSGTIFDRGSNQLSMDRGSNQFSGNQLNMERANNLIAKRASLNTGGASSSGAAGARAAAAGFGSDLNRARSMEPSGASAPLLQMSSTLRGLGGIAGLDGNRFMSVVVVRPQLSVLNDHMHTIQALSGSQVIVRPNVAAADLFTVECTGSDAQIDLARQLMEMLGLTVN